KVVRVHSSEIGEAVQEPIQQIVDAVRRALEITPPELASDIVARLIVMTGGGALVRGLYVLLTREWGLCNQLYAASINPVRHVAVVAQRDSASLAATFVPELRSENTRPRGLLGLGVRLGSGYVPAEVLHAAEPTNPLTFIVSAGRKQGVKPLSAVVSPEGLV